MAIITFTEIVTFKARTCSECGVQFAITEEFENKLRESHQTFYCPNGHSRYFPQDNEAEKLRKELKRKEQELADKAIQAIAKQNELEAKIKKQGKDLKRLTNGVCPCCNRTFSNLHDHMKKQHPEQVIKKR